MSIKLLRQGHEVFLWRKFMKEQNIDKYLIDEDDKTKDLNDIMELCYKYKIDAHKHLEDYFTEAVFVNNNENGIYDGIKEVLTNLDEYTLKTISLKKKLSSQWDILYNDFETKLEKYP
jgi:hypothetical protein